MKVHELIENHCKKHPKIVELYNSCSGCSCDVKDMFRSTNARSACKDMKLCAFMKIVPAKKYEEWNEDKEAKE